MLLRIKLPFEPSGPACAAALGALEDCEFVHKSVENNARGLAFLTREIRGLGIQVVPSAANFVMLVLANEEQAQTIFEKLLQRGVIVRLLKSTGLPQCLRISVGTPEENQSCVEALKRVLEEMEMNPYAEAC